MKRSMLKLSFVAVFFAGFVAASVLPSLGEWLPLAHADRYACIRQDLDARGMSGNIPDPSFTITYTVPSCYGSSGYSVKRVYMYGGEVAVRYEK